MLFIFMSATEAFACPQFSGRYSSVEDDGNILTLTLTQKGCEKLFMDYSYSDGTRFTKTMIFDGVYRTIFDEPTFQTIESFVMAEDEIQLAAKLHNKVTGSKNSLKGRMTLDPEGNIVEDRTFFKANGKAGLRVIVVHTLLSRGEHRPD